jgi:rhodanese-related sulfurtransferase
MSMRLISRDALWAKLERGDDFRLLMVLSANAYEAKHIPGSLHFATWQDALAALDPSEEIVVYCAGEYCAASIRFYVLLERNGYTRVRRYAGGLADWEAAGYPIASSRGTQPPDNAPSLRDRGPSLPTSSEESQPRPTINDEEEEKIHAT